MNRDDYLAGRHSEIDGRINRKENRFFEFSLKFLAKDRRILKEIAEQISQHKGIVFNFDVESERLTITTEEASFLFFIPKIKLLPRSSGSYRKGYNGVIMRKYLTKGISTPISMGIVFFIFLLAMGGYLLVLFRYCESRF